MNSPISEGFRRNALKALCSRHDFTPSNATDADLYWQTVCDLGAYTRLRLLEHFNPSATGALTGQNLEYPKVCVTLGSGLGAFADTLDDRLVIPFKNLPGLEFVDFKEVPGHQKSLVAGRLKDGTPIVVLAGRIHPYERNLNVNESALLTAAIFDSGIEKFVLTNAAGSLDKKYLPGSVMLATSIIKTSVPNFGTGLDHPYAGILFYPAHTISTKYHDLLAEKFTQLGVLTFCGSYVQYPGRRYEFPAEIAALAAQRRLMIDQGFESLAPGAVGMSTGHEVECICQLATREEFQTKPLPEVVILSVITNLGAGLSEKPPSHEEVQTECEKLSPNFVQVLGELTNRMSA